MVSLLLSCPTFPESRHLQGHLLPPDSLALTLLCYYLAPKHWLFNFPLSATILWALRCSRLESVCLLAVCVLRWGKGRWGASFCVHIIRRETMPKHFRERGASWWECHQQRQRCSTPAKIIKTYGLKSPRTLMCTQSRLKGNISN